MAPHYCCYFLRQSLRSSCWPRTYSVAEDDLEFNPPAFTSCTYCTTCCDAGAGVGVEPMAIVPYASTLPTETDLQLWF